MTRLTLADWKSLQAKKHGFKSQNKYRAKRVESDGQWFDSKAECARYEELKFLRRSGKIRWFVRQVPFHLPGSIKYLADFLIVWTDGRVTVEDVKGVITPLSSVKMKQVEAIYSITIDIVRRKR